MEDIHKSSEKFCNGVFIFYVLLSILISPFYHSWYLAAIINLGSFAVLLVCKFILGSNLIYRFALAIFLFLYPALFAIQMDGFPLMHLFYFYSAWVLSIFRVLSIMLVGLSFFALQYLFFAFLLLNNQADTLSYFQLKFAEKDQAVIWMLFFPLLSIITHYFRSKVLIDTTQKNLAYVNKIEKKLRFNQKNKSFAQEILNKNFEFAFIPDKEDEIGEILFKLRDNLKEASQKEYKENFYNAGIAGISEILRNKSDEIDRLLREFLDAVVKYVDVQQGGIFIKKKDAELLELKASYGYNLEQFKNNTFETGVGLIGQTYLNKKTKVIDQLNESYFAISLNVGSIKNAKLYLIPLKYNDLAEGVLELASLHSLEDFKINWLEKIAESLAITINNYKVNENTNLLLADTQLQAEMLRAQEEEMRQNMEELMATQESMRLKQTELERANQKIQANEVVLKKAFEKNKEIETGNKKMITELKEENAQLKLLLENVKQTKQEETPPKDELNVPEPEKLTRKSNEMIEELEQITSDFQKLIQ